MGRSLVNFRSSLDNVFNFRVEFLDDPENKIVRPRQNYKGYTKRDYISVEDRKQV